MTDAPTANAFAFGPVDGFNEPHPEGSYVRLSVDKQVVRMSRCRRGARSRTAGRHRKAARLRCVDHQHRAAYAGHEIQQATDDYDLGYNDAVDDAMRAFGEAVEEVKGEAA